jgi:uncharacterized protein YcbK (DUF882 family)
MNPVHYSEITEWPWKNFTPKEISCKGSGLILVDPYSMDCLQKMRIFIRKPLIINSAYRSPEHNKAIGGSPKSQHVLGKAFDIRITPDVSRETISRYARLSGFKGIGDYNTFVHVDTGPQRYWDLRK